MFESFETTAYFPYNQYFFSLGRYLIHFDPHYIYLFTLPFSTSFPLKIVHKDDQAFRIVALRCGLRSGLGSLRFGAQFGTDRGTFRHTGSLGVLEMDVISLEKKI